MEEIKQISKLPSVKERIKDTKYLYNNEIRIWNGQKLLCQHNLRKDKCKICKVIINEYKDEKYTKEQIEYIENKNLNVNTKLIACAGSGKTKCVIGRVKYMINNLKINKNVILILSFNKSIATELQNKLSGIINKSNVRTIDSFSYFILNKLNIKTTIVGILSLLFKNWLYNDPNIKLIPQYKHIFIDESQDLNETQYNILTKLNELLNCKIHLIGDPNQNIYSFRNSNSKYLNEFNIEPIETFKLTYNFRSSDNIIKFGELFRKYYNNPIKTYNQVGEEINIIVDNPKQLTKNILQIIKNKQSNQSLSILAPYSKYNKYVLSLSDIYNELKLNGINNVIQLYNENENSEYDTKYNQLCSNKISLGTWHSSKGLEWDIVILINFQFNIMKKIPTQEEHFINSNLFYVACSQSKTKFIYF